MPTPTPGLRWRGRLPTRSSFSKKGRLALDAKRPRLPARPDPVRRKNEAPVDRHLIRVRQLLLQSKETFTDMLDKMAKIGGVIGRAGNSLRSKPEQKNGR